MTKNDLVKINDYLWEIPKKFRPDMRVAARIYISEKMMDKIFEDRSLEQLINVATLPGIVNWALAMPDIHEGYGFPIGGVAAMDIEKGVISPGGVGFDINCGVRILRSGLNYDEAKQHIVNLTNQIQRDVPSGVGRGGALKLGPNEMDSVLEKGMKWLLEKGYAQKEDIEHCEEQGSMPSAKADFVSERAKARGKDQLGTLGAGNHFLEVQRVDKILDKEMAEKFGLFENQITMMIHTGSRGLGHQVCTDYVKIMHNAMKKYRIVLPDPQLACVPIESAEGKQYFGAMSAAANYAWSNRQMITHLVRQAWQRILGQAGKLELIYDVAHNMAKKEDYNGQRLCVHRKGATRAFPAGHPEVPLAYQKIGQPVLIPGTMGTASYILVGTAEAMKNSFGSVCHGAGRLMSRHAAIKQVAGAGINLKKQLEEKGIVVRGQSRRGLAEEAPLAYKDIDDVVDVVAKAGLAKIVARLRPLGVVKG